MNGTRIAQRPRAFGPMEHGPALYRDTDSEEMQLLASFRVRTVFPKDVLAELRTLPRDPDPADYAGRQDLRGELLYTIGFLTVGFSYALLLGAGAVPLTMIPFLGAIVTCLTALVIAS